MDISLEDVDKFAEEAHKGQLYGDEPYINHPRRVADKMETTFEKTVALLHDVVEDTDIPLSEIEQRFGAMVAEEVRIVTRRKDEEYTEYIRRVGSSRHEIAVKVKIADLEDHTTHAQSLTPSLRMRYYHALDELRKAQEERAEAERVRELTKKFKHIIGVHTIGDVDIIEYSRTDGNGKPTGDVWFQPCIAGENTGYIFDTLDLAIVGALATKYDGRNSQATYFIDKMLGISTGGNKND